MHRLAYLFLLSGLYACQLGSDQPADDYASWSVVNRDGSWTKTAEAAVRRTSLPRSLPTDVGTYCPQYSYLNDASRVKFWVGLLSAMAEFESDLDPQTRYTETLRDGQGRPVVSRGLLQISIESANQERYACQIGTANDLHDPAINIRCGAKILSNWVSSDGVIASSRGENRGGARYWSVLRSTNSSLTDISKRTSRLDFCVTTP